MLACRRVLFIASGLCTGLASAQSLPGGGVGGASSPASSGSPTLSGAGVGASAGSSGLAQTGVPREGGGGRGLTIVPRIDAGVTYSDNAGFSTVDRRSDFIFEVSPGVRVSSYGGRVRGFFDYTLRGLTYASGTLPASLNNQLNGLATFEAVERKVFIDVGGRISRATVSAFGVQPSDASRNSPNTTEVRTYFVSPYARGRLLSRADYELRYRSSVSSSEATPASNATIQELVGYLREDYPSRHIGWAIEGGRSIVNYKVTRDVDATTVRGVLSVIVNPQFRFYGLAGRETNNFLSEEQRGYSTVGYGLRWLPSGRTRLDFEQQRRFFGEAHAFVAETRTPQSALRLSDRRDIVIGRGFDDIGSQGTVYDLLFSQFASIEPDPDRRAQLVNQTLQRTGLNGTAPASSSVFASSTTLRREQVLSYALIGKRNTVTLQVGQSNSRLLDNTGVIDGDFTRAGQIRQRRASLTYAHALTPLSTINVTGAVQTASGSGSGSAQSANLRSLSIGYTSRLAPKLFFSAGARKSFSSSGDAASFDELAVFGRVSLRF